MHTKVSPTPGDDSHSIIVSYADNEDYILVDFQNQNGSRRQMMEWIDVKDRLPKEEGWKIVYCIDGITVMFFQNGGWLDIIGFPRNDVTHWIPLPEPPGGGRQ